MGCLSRRCAPLERHHLLFEASWLYDYSLLKYELATNGRE
jgi:hypothetical protein